jgi:hypothetical protein
MGPLGILVWSALVALKLHFLYKYVFLMAPSQRPKTE